MIKNKIVFIGLLIIISALLTGCGSGILSGIIIDEGLKPVQGAIVYTNPASQSVGTNPDGQYIIRNIPVGQYSVSARKEGYKEGSVDVSIYPDKVTSCDIQIAKNKRKY